MATRKKTVAKNNDVLEKQSHKDDRLPNVDGLVFRWVNLAYRSQAGWGIWAPVTKGSDLAAKAEEFFVTNHMGQFHGVGTSESEFYFNGSQSILAFTTVEKRDAYRQDAKKRTDDQLRLVMDQHGSKGKIRYTTIPQEPTD